MARQILFGYWSYKSLGKSMQLKILSRRMLLLIVILSGATFSVAFLLYFIPKSSIPSESTLILGNAVALQKQEQVSSELPIRLTIPKIKVDATIEQVGLVADGSMDVSKDPANVAWFNLGPRPGDNGSAVIAGHYGWKNGIPAAFDDLHKLVKGDKLYVEDGKGATTTFVVREVRTYGQNEDASDVFTSSDGKAHLNLITCEGVWDKIKKSYSKRLVVFTDKEVKF